MKFFLIAGLFFSTFLLWSCSENKKKSSKDLILGEWIEVRRDNRGHLGFREKPSLQLSFSKDGTGTFFNNLIPDSLVIRKYNFINDSTFFFITTNEIKMIDSKKLILVLRFNSKEQSELDLFCTFLKKEVYQSLSEEEKQKFQEQTSKDLDAERINDSIKKTAPPPPVR
jgi:hypothetical protein